jgi:hypothetical protein
LPGFGERCWWSELFNCSLLSLYGLHTGIEVGGDRIVEVIADFRQEPFSGLQRASQTS